MSEGIAALNGTRARAAGACIQQDAPSGEKDYEEFPSGGTTAAAGDARLEKEEPKKCAPMILTTLPLGLLVLDLLLVHRVLNLHVCHRCYGPEVDGTCRLERKGTCA